MYVRGRAPPPPGGCAPPGTRSGRGAWPLGSPGGCCGAPPPAWRGVAAPAGRGAARHGAAPACAHCHGVQGHAGRRRTRRRGILFAPEGVLDYMGRHPRGTHGRPRSHAGRGGVSLAESVYARRLLALHARAARSTVPMRLRAYVQFPRYCPAPPRPQSALGARLQHPRCRKFGIFACEGAGAAPLHASRLAARVDGVF